MAGFPKDLKQWWPTLKPACTKRLILITYELQEKQKRKNPWSYPQIQRARQLITLLNQKSTSFFPLQKFKGNQPVSEMAAMCLVHSEEESAERDEEVETEDPDGINGVTEEFMVHLAWTMKDAQVEEKHCHHCGSPKHFIHDCPLVRASKENAQLNCKEEMASRKGAWTPQMKRTTPKNPQEEVPKA